MFEEIKHFLFSVDLDDKYVKIVLHRLVQRMTRVEITDKLKGLGFEQTDDSLFGQSELPLLWYRWTVYLAQSMFEEIFTRCKIVPCSILPRM